MTNRKDWPLALSVRPSDMNSQSFEELAAMGITQTELSSGDIAPYYDDLDFIHRAGSIVAAAREHGVEISSLHLPFAPFERLDPASFDKAVRDYAVEKQSELLSACADAGIHMAIIHPSGEPYPENERSDRLDAAVETISRICEAAKSGGITLCLENLPRTCLCRTSDEMLFLLERIPDLRVVFDTNHSLREDNIHYIEAVGKKIVTLHVSDYDFIDERHWLPLEGKNDWEAIIETLEKVDYTGRFLYETEHIYTYAQIAENYLRLIKS